MTVVLESLAVAPTFVREDARGTFLEVVNQGPWESVITGSMRAGAVMGRHYHKVTRAYFFIVRGAADVWVADVRSGERERTRLEDREGIHLEPHHAHAIRFGADSTFLLLKSQPYRAENSDTYPFAMVLDVV